MKERIDRPTATITAATLATLLLVPSLAAEAPNAPNLVGQTMAGEVRANAAVPGTETATFQVKGMTCGGCVIAVRTALNRLEGVEEAEVRMDEGTAVVSYDPAQVNAEEIAEAIGRAGFDAEVVEGR